MLTTTNRLVSSLLPEQFQRLQQELNNSLIDFHNGLRATQGLLSTNLWVNQGEDKHELLIQIELPGYEEEQITVEITENRIRVTAKVSDVQEHPEEKRLKQEREHNPVRREYQVPFHVDAAKSSASYQKGILELRLSRAQVSKTQLLKINTLSE